MLLVFLFMYRNKIEAVAPLFWISMERESNLVKATDSSDPQSPNNTSLLLYQPLN
jgi:hypothetical protein